MFSADELQQRRAGIVDQLASLHIEQMAAEEHFLKLGQALRQELATVNTVIAGINARAMLQSADEQAAAETKS